MKLYNFSMERVLEWRENQEKSSMEEFALLQNELNYEKSILLDLIKEYETSKDKNHRNINVNELRQLQLYRQVLEDRIDCQNRAIVKKTNELETVRLELVDAQKDRRVMEKLKERDFSKYKDDIRYAEQREIDEIAVLRFKTIKI